MDKALQDRLPKLNIRIAENPFNLQMSNLTLNVDLSGCQNRFFKVPLDVSVTAVRSEADQRMREIAEANEYIATSSFSLDGSYESKQIELTIPLTITVDKQDDDNTHQYVVLHETDGNVEVVYSRQSDHCITFETEEWGSYLLAYRQTPNQISREDAIENNRYVLQQDPAWIYVCALILIIMIMLVAVIKRKHKKKVLKRQVQLIKDRKA